jgi:hypothetical protein
MKKYILFCTYIWFHFSVSAQDIVTSFLDNHRKDDNLELISIGKKMMEMMYNALSSDNPDLKEAIKGLETIRIVSSKDQDLNKEYFNSAQTLLSKSKGLEEFFSVSEEDNKLIVMIRKSKRYVKEIILLSEQPEGFSLISISGAIDLDVLLKYSEGLNIKELNQLRSVKSNQ